MTGIIPLAKINSHQPEETPVRDALMKRLAGLIDSGPNKTTGVDRRVRHIGSYVEQSSSIHAMQKITLQDAASLVSSFANS